MERRYIYLAFSLKTSSIRKYTGYSGRRVQTLTPTRQPYKGTNTCATMSLSTRTRQGSHPTWEMLVSSCLGQFAVCSENVAVGMEEKVFVSFSDSPERFWLQFSSGTSTLERIGDALADYTITSAHSSLWGVKMHGDITVEPLITDPPISGQPPKSGQAPRNGLKLP